MAGSVVLAPGVSLELWQTDRFTLDTPKEKVWNVPLISDLLVYPVIFRTIANTADALPTVGKIRKLMAERLAVVEHQNDDEDADDAASTPFDDEEEEEEEEEEAEVVETTDDEEEELYDTDDDDEEDDDEEDDDDDIDDDDYMDED